MYIIITYLRGCDFFTWGCYYSELIKERNILIFSL